MLYLDSHGIAVEELAKHKHPSGLGWRDPERPDIPDLSDTMHGRCDANRPNNNWYSDFTGEDKPHNTMQPSKAVHIWHRTA